MIRSLSSFSRSLAGPCLSLALALACTLGARSAQANGRFPNAQQLRELAPGKIVVAGTYGLLISGNAGKDFGYVCESQLFGKTTMGSWVDPLLESLADGTLVTGSHDQARRTSDFGCSFNPIWSLPHNPDFLPPDPGATGGNGSVIDVCPSYDGKGGVLALTRVAGADQAATQELRLYKSADGSTWTALGKPIPTTTMNLGLTLDAAPGRPQRIYVSGSLKSANVLAVTDDAGETWSATDITVDDPDAVAGVYIAGVSPSEAQRVYLRAQREMLSDDGSTTWDDSLIVSDDGGKTFRDVLRRKGSLMGFALSPDGKTVAAGFGDPMVPPTLSTDTDLGIYGASASDLTFTQSLPLLPVSCLRWTSTGLYVCARDDDPTGMLTPASEFHIGLYSGAGLPTKAEDVKSLLKLQDVRGPLPWADKRMSACTMEWLEGDPSDPSGKSVCDAFGACMVGGTTPPSADAYVCGAPTSTGGSGGGGGGGASSTGGAGAQSGGSGATSGGATASGGSSGSVSGGAGGGAISSGGSSNAGAGGDSGGSGCGCELAGRRDRGEGLGLLVLALAALRRRSRDERKSPTKPER